MNKLLVVDDNEDILFLLKNSLRRKVYEVSVSVSYREALSIFYSFRPQLVLLYVNVGEEIKRNTQKNQTTGRLPSHTGYSDVSQPG